MGIMLDAITHTPDNITEKVNELASREISINAAILTLRETYVATLKLREYSSINCGMCFKFAENICSIFKDAVKTWDQMGLHCYVVYNGLCFDAECPEGAAVDDDLPFFQRRVLQQNLVKQMAKSI